MRPSRIFRYALVLCASLLLGNAGVAAQTAAANDRQSQLPALKQLTLEELLDVDVTLPLRRAERVADAPAAIGVLTSEDVRRSGALTLAEALRHAPGLFVGRFSASSWIIGARGFNSTAANKLQVMIDGRSVYSPLFSGVFWDQQDVNLHDVERIEVVRGPGATLWGSNAVNGVINVVSRPAAETQGTLVDAAAGNEEQAYALVRHGGTAGPGHFRIYGKFFERDAAKLPGGIDASDGSRFGQGGVRFDFGDAARRLTIQGDAYASRAALAGRPDLATSGANVLARVVHQISPASSLQAQAYYDRSARDVPLQFKETRDTVDLDAQHRVGLGGRHALTWGAAFRVSRDDTVPTPLLRFQPEDRTTTLASVFVQDEIDLTAAWRLLVGTKVEHNTYTGAEVQPSARVRWTPDRRHVFWGAVSRAARLPSRVDADIRVLNAAGAVAIQGNPDFESEQLIALEAGYRAAPSSVVSVDLAVFHNRYDELRSQELGVPVIIGNMLNAQSSGLELTGRLQPRASVLLSASYAYLTKTLSLDPGSRDITRGSREAVDPTHQLLLLGRLTLPRNVEFDTAVRTISSLPEPGTPAYTEASLRLAWRVSDHVELAFIGRDLVHDRHLEFVSPTSGVRTQFERSFTARVTLAF